MPNPTARLVLIPFSHFCEKGRWSLERAGLPFVEEPHMPGASMRASKAAGGNGQTPVCVLADGQVLRHSGAILEHAVAAAPEAFGNEDATPDEEPAALMRRLDDELGPHARRLAYGHLLPETRTMKAFLRSHAPARQRWMAGIGYPVVRATIRKFLKINPESVERSRQRCDEAFDAVAEHLATRPMLGGARFGALDLTFAALAAPLVFPDQGAEYRPPLEALPAEYVALVEGYRSHPAGRHALRCYAEQRAATPAG